MVKSSRFSTRGWCIWDATSTLPVAQSHPDVAVAVKVEGDADCFGFTNESYEAGNVWRKSEYRLPMGHYIVKARASSGEIQSDTVRFVLRNDGPSLTDLWLDVPKQSGLRQWVRRRLTA
jgi:hypothetical protein